MRTFATVASIALVVALGATSSQLPHLRCVYQQPAPGSAVRDTTLDATTVSVGRPAHLDGPKHFRGPGGPGGFGADRGPRPSDAPTPGVPG